MDLSRSSAFKAATLPRNYILSVIFTQQVSLMRLIQFFDDGFFRLVNFPDSNKVPFYGILSHRWGGDGEEITFEELMGGQRLPVDGGSLRPGFRKLQFCQRRAAEEGLRYFWIDTCCINKRDIIELSYSLNSMFHWYQKAVRCYVYLDDVSYTADKGSSPSLALRDSKWFTRGWTLQELLAPSSVVFYTRQETRMGDKKDLEETLYDITKISVRALRGNRALSEFGVEERFSWAEHRETKRPEDAAYSLLGIFDVRLTPVYSDGDPKHLKRKAIGELRRNIDASEVVEDTIRIGGASWRDLSALNDKRLKELDEGIRQYTNWFCQQGQPATTENITQMSTDAGRKMKELLGSFEVGYNDDSGLHGKITTWQEPWRRFTDHPVKFEKVRGFLDNRWWISNGPEDCHTAIMAAKTLLDLIIWRDIRDLR
jgi:hypothetical protein